MRKAEWKVASELCGGRVYRPAHDELATATGPIYFFDTSMRRDSHRVGGYPPHFGWHDPGNPAAGVK